MEPVHVERFFLGCLAHASYMIASEGVAAVIDPQRDVDLYIEAAAGTGWKIDYIIETHLHADFVSGHRELAERTSRWATVGVVVDWEHWDRLHRDAGLLPPKDEHALPYESVLHDRPTTAGGSQVGYVTSFMYSPVLQRHIGLALVRPDLAEPGSEVHMEVAVHHSNTTVLARTARTPLFNPARKTAKA